tara:strand:+ start:106 stop:453 length:348 start_codon:yes stop_codon:yes gene_type:complete
MNFTEITSKFWRLGLGKFKNGVGLNTVVLFNAIAHTDYDNLTVENANDKLWKMYGFTFNSATLSRNNTNLMELGLIKLKESPEDRRYKQIFLTERGKDFRRMLNADGDRIVKVRK